MFIGPVFTRELVTSPRRVRFYVARAVYVGALLLLMCTAWLVLTGTQVVRNVGDMARFGSIIFQILAPLQLVLAMVFSAILSASAVAQEKDKGTLDLLLLTRMTNGELVLGKLLASLLGVLVLLAAAVPLFMLSALFGGVSFDQIARVFAVTVATSLVAGSLGALAGLWREKTFQALALTAIVLGFWVAGIEIFVLGATMLGRPDLAVIASGFSPWRAILLATRPAIDAAIFGSWTVSPVDVFLATAFGWTVLLNAISIARVRTWNRAGDTPVRPEETPEEAAAQQRVADQSGRPAVSVHAAPGKTREVWDNPILWREICTWAYGRKVLVVRLAFWLLFALAAVALHSLVQSEQGLSRVGAATVLLPLFVLSLLLVNALAVTSLTNERDGRALDLLLVTDLSPKEVIFGKLGGVFYNTKEMVLLPMLLSGYLWWVGELSLENLLYLVGGLAVMYAFVAMLGMHVGMTYDNSRTAIAVSLGTVIFLFVGIAVCMRIMLAFSGSFQMQLAPFLAFVVGGGVGLFLALGARNPSPAILLASLICPFAMFWAITSFLLDPPYTLGVFIVTALTYGFTTAAMLIPAIFEFDVATGRTTSGQE